MTAVHRAHSASPYEKDFGFCRALVGGDRIYVSGTAPIGSNGEAVGHSAAEQMRRCLQIIEAAVIELGGAMNQVVRTRIYLTHREDWESVARVHGEVFSAHPPTATCVVVKELLDPAWRVEVEAEALLVS
jgi:enamine deaminase RidA (YjgF/YER057c/UK114 family)